MAGINRFEDVQAWQKARKLVAEIYKMCSQETVSKDFGFRNQICRAAISSMNNIAEGWARKSDRDFAHFLDVARGSVTEVQSMLYVAYDISYIEEAQREKLYQLAAETASLISGFTTYLRRK